MPNGRFLVTAFAHAQDDIGRARRLSALGAAPPTNNDVLRAAWMMAVGAFDAYCCDAYVELLSRTLRAKSEQKRVKLKDAFMEIKVPVNAFFREKDSGWQWRLAAQELMKKESVLSLEAMKNLMNRFLPRSYKLMNNNALLLWSSTTGASTRLFGALPLGPHPDFALVRDTIDKRFKKIFQRRNDCIHNCDRPRHALQSISPVNVNKVIDDIEFLLFRIDEDLKRQFPKFLEDAGFTLTTINHVT